MISLVMLLITDSRALIVTVPVNYNCMPILFFLHYILQTMSLLPGFKRKRGWDAGAVRQFGGTGSQAGKKAETLCSCKEF